MTFLVVRREHERRLERPIDLLHQLQNSGAGPAVEVRRRLVRQDDLRMCREGPRDRDPLALSAAQLRRPVARKLAELDDVQKSSDALAAPVAIDLLELQQRVLDVLFGGQHGQKVECLKDEADGSRAQIGELVAVRPETSSSSMKILPVVGVSMQPMRLSSVDLPLPRGRRSPGRPLPRCSSSRLAAPEPADRRGDTASRHFRRGSGTSK
jgi:hypothetical protein